uniref:Cell adhesion molecule L1 like n=1 Tax=Leptobrachium leishanense TaxID=445787 RepID=A0A8C5WG79_9ANUR
MFPVSLCSRGQEASDQATVLALTGLCRKLISCRYKWTRNEKHYDPYNDPNVKTYRNSGTFTILPNENITHHDGTYRCYASNPLGTAISEDTKFIVPGVPKFPNEAIPPLVVEEGSSVVLRCDPPQGLSPVHLFWMTLDLVHIPQDERVSVGQDGNLYFANVKMSDSRTDYGCFASFSAIRTIVQKVPMTLSVLSSNSFKERLPKLFTPQGISGPITVLKGEVLMLECIPEGLKTIIENYGKHLKIKDIIHTDHGIYRCTATNNLGSTHHDFHVHVEEPPRWKQMPKSSIQRVGSSIEIHCSASGNPKPEILWKRNGQPLERKSIEKMVYGEEIIIDNLQLSDSAVYQCEATNKHGTILSNANINVIGTVMGINSFISKFDHLEPTKVSLLPENPWVQRSHSITLTCHVQSDRRLRSSLKITWWKNGQEMTKHNRRIHLKSYTLLISNVTWEDEGTYSCIGRTSMDSMEAETRLSVRDVPGAPENLHLFEKHRRSVTLMWSESESNNSPISEYLIQSKRSRKEPGHWEDLTKVQGNVTLIVLHLKPYYSYQFRVIAINEIGMSLPSASSKVYSTPPAVPDINPALLYVEMDNPNEISIRWEPLNTEEYNGPELQYRVSWRLQGVETEWHHENVKQHQFLIKNTPAFVPYDVYVQSVNEMGVGPEPQVHTVFSGEDVPDAPPANVAVEIVNSSAVTVSWNEIPQDRVRGRLSGYKIMYWRLRNLVDINKRHAEHHALIFSGHRESGMISGLSPFSRYIVSVSAFNTKGDGPGSTPLDFETPEGVPEKPHFLQVINSDENSFTLSWAPPRKANGILKGYVLQHKIINGTDETESLTNINIGDPQATSWRVPRMQGGTMYKFNLQACTRVGCGRAVSEEGWTLTQFQNIWGPRLPTLGINITMKLFLNHVVLMEAYADGPQSLAAQGWFIGIMCAVALLTLVLLSACFVQRNKGGKYPGKKVDPPVMKDEGFIEYSPSYKAALNGSLKSLSSGSKSYDSVDSLVEYSDEEHHQFNEDGSFIGAYNNSKDKTSREVNEMT